MGPEVVNKNRNCVFNGPYAGRDLYITMLEDNEREFVVTHNANIKPVSYFTGRETELQELRQRIEDGRKSVLVSGMGGIGKTHICRKLFEEYLNKYAEDENELFRHIGYIEYDGKMGSSLQKCLKFKQQDSPEHNLEAAWRELEYLASDGKLLLFVDNVNESIASDPGLERLKHIPGAIVLTSRRTSFSTEFEPYRIGFLNTGQLREIYEKIRFEDSGKRLNEEDVPILDYIIDELAARHTITVEFLAHLAQTKHWTMQRLRDELEKKGFCLEYTDGEDKLVNIQKSYETLYDLSVLTKAEQNILEAFSVFPYIPLSVETCNDWLLADARVCLKNHSRNLQTRSSANENDDILMGLYRKGWLQFDIEQESYALHPVFAQFIYRKCEPKAESHFGLIHSCEESLQVPESGSPLVCQQYLPFAENIIIKLNLEKDVNQSMFIDSIAYLFQYISEYKKAKVLYEKSLWIRKKVLGEEHRDTVASYNNLAGVYVRQGEYGKAKVLYEKNLRIGERVLGEDHLDTAIIYNNLAFLYLEQGKYSEAEDLYKKSLQIRERVQGEGHLFLAESYNNLAGVYMRQSEYSKAEELYKKSLQIRERVQGEDHPDTAGSYCSLAGVYARQGDYRKAKGLCEKSLRIRKNVLGEDHLDTATSYHNLAEVYAKQEEYRKAEELYKKSLRIRENVLGEDHPDIASGYSNLARVYAKQEEYRKAEELYKKSLRIRENVLGEDHPDTATSYHNLAEVYAKQEKYRKAEELYKKSLQISVKVLGEDHPDTAASYHNLAVVYYHRGEYEIALTYYLNAYKVVVFRFGINHPNTQIVYDNMKITYRKWNPKGNFKQWLEENMDKE